MFILTGIVLFLAFPLIAPFVWVIKRTSDAKGDERVFATSCLTVLGSFGVLVGFLYFVFWFNFVRVVQRGYFSQQLKDGSRIEYRYARTNMTPVFEPGNDDSMTVTLYDGGDEIAKHSINSDILPEGLMAIHASPASNKVWTTFVDTDNKQKVWWSLDIQTDTFNDNDSNGSMFPKWAGFGPATTIGLKKLQWDRNHDFVKVTDVPVSAKP